MYATGIGLVMKGFENETPQKQVESPVTGQVKTHSTKTRGSFFDTLLTKSKNFFAEEE
jgi:cell division protein FtsA